MRQNSKLDEESEVKYDRRESDIAVSYTLHLSPKRIMHWISLIAVFSLGAVVSNSDLGESLVRKILVSSLDVSVEPPPTLDAGIEPLDGGSG